MTAEFDAREQLRQELLMHARNSAYRALEYSEQYAINVNNGDSEAAGNCQLLAYMSSDEAVLEAWEAGEVAATNISQKELEDPIFTGLFENARSSMKFAMEKVREAQSLALENKDFEMTRLLAYRYKMEALTNAYEAGRHTGDGTRRYGGIRPTFSSLPGKMATS